jgi:hypothetical protein
VDSCSANDHGGQPSGLIVGQRLQSFKRQVPTLQLPLVVLLEQQRANETRYGGFVRGMPTTPGDAPTRRSLGLDARLRPDTVRPNGGLAPNTGWLRQV